MIDSDRRITSVAFSLYRYLHDESYTVDGSVTAQRLYEWFPGLQYIDAYPDDIVQIKLPTLAVTSPERIGTGTQYYGEAIHEDAMTAMVYGFVLGQGNRRANLLYRDRLVNDLRALTRSGTVLPLFDQPTKVAIGTIEIVRAEVRVLPANAPEIEAERFKFLAELEFEYA